MPEDNDLPPQGENEGPISTTEEVLRLLREQSSPSSDDDALDNPELEQLLGKLSKGLEEGIDSIPGVEPPGPLTLEDLVLGLPSAPPAQESSVCAECGSQNPVSTRFCGMCGHELGTSKAGNVSVNGSEGVAAFEAVPAAVASATQAAAPATASRGWKIACLGLLCLLLGLVAYQQQLWRLPLLRKPVSQAAPAVPTAPKAPPAATNVVVESVPEPSQLSHPSAPPPSPTAKPSKPESPAPSPVLTPSKTALAAKPSAAPPLRIGNRVAAERAPEIPLPAVPIELPNLIKPPGTSPVLQDAPPAPPASVSPVPKVSEGAVQGTLMHRVDPQYPRSARSVHIQGRVVLKATIGTDGLVQQVSAISGSPVLVNAATEAVKKWRYRPFLLDGKPVEGETIVTFDFKGE